MLRAPRAGRVALESTSAAFQTAAIPSQLPAREKAKGPVVIDTGPFQSSEQSLKAWRQQRLGYCGSVLAERPANRCSIWLPELNREFRPFMTVSLKFGAEGSFDPPCFGPQVSRPRPASRQTLGAAGMFARISNSSH
jgi:hypothetical protein